MEPEIAKKLDRITLLLVSNMLVIAVACVCLVVGIIPKMERAVAASERIEKRVHGMADSLDPVLSKSAGKAIESIENIDTKKLSKTATDASDALIKAAADKAKSLLEGKKDDSGAK